MSISTQPTARQTSLQRALSARLSVNTSSEPQAVKTASDLSLLKPDFPTQRNLPSANALEVNSSLSTHEQLLDGCHPSQRKRSLLQTQPVHVASAPAQLQPDQATSTASELARFDALKKTIVTQPVHMASVPAQLRLDQATSTASEPARINSLIGTTSTQPVHVADVPAQLRLDQAASTASEPARFNTLKRTSSTSAGHSRKRALPEHDAEGSLDLHAEQLQAEYAAMRAGTGQIADKAAWVKAARQTAHQVSKHSLQAMSLLDTKAKLEEVVMTAVCMILMSTHINHAEAVASSNFPFLKANRASCKHKAICQDQTQSQVFQLDIVCSALTTAAPLVLYLVCQKYRRTSSVLYGR